MPFRDQAAAELSFGDFCRAEFFYDAYLRADAANLAEQTASNDYVKKKYKRDVLTSYVPVDDSLPALKAKAGADFLLAHGARFDEAVCLADDCEIASRLGRDGASPPAGRLAFAPVTKLKEEERPTLTEANWGRMLVDDAVIELRRPFTVAAEDIAERLAADQLPRRSLDETTALQLSTWWSAYACRRGPLVDAVNLRKIALIGEAGGDDERAKEIERTLKQLLFFAWRLEGHAVELGGELYDDHKTDLGAVDWPALVDSLAEDFAHLEQVSAAVRRVLS